jgi:hypothetical protein
VALTLMMMMMLTMMISHNLWTLRPMRTTPSIGGSIFLAKTNSRSSSWRRHLKETSFVAATRQHSALKGITVSYNKIKTVYGQLGYMTNLETSDGEEFKGCWLRILMRQTYKNRERLTKRFPRGPVPFVPEAARRG